MNKTNEIKFIERCNHIMIDNKDTNPEVNKPLSSKTSIKK